MTTTDCVNMYKNHAFIPPGNINIFKFSSKKHGMPKGSKTKKKQCKLYVIVKQLSI